MSAGARASRPALALGGVAGVDLLVRLVLDLLYASDPVAIAIGGGALISRYVLDAATLTWTLGWVVLGMAVFVVTPRLFPDELLEWARGMPGRTVLTLGTVAVALSLDSAFAALAVFEPSVVDPPPLALLAVVTVVLVLVPVTWKLPRWCSGVPLVNCPEQTLLRTGSRIRPGEILARILLIIPFGALFLVLLSRLFPIPEILLVVLAIAEMVRSARPGTSTAAGGRKDVVERAILGLGAVWFGPEAVLALVYAAVPVFFVLYVDLRALEMFAGPVTPTTVGFVLATLGVATLSVVVASVRLIERLPRAFLAEDVGADVRLADRFEDLHPRIPGLALLPTALVVVFESQAPAFFQEFAPRPAFTLAVSPFDLWAALTLAGVTLVVTLRAAWFADLRLLERDYHAAVASTALFVGIPLGYGVAVGTENPAVAPVSLPVLVAVVVYGLVGLLLSPFLGYELFDEEPDGPGQSRFSLLASEAKTAFLAVVGFSIFSAIVLDPLIVFASRFVPEDIVTMLIGPIWAPITVGLLVRLALLPFYLPERVFG
jgi:hypothetical protein